MEHPRTDSEREGDGDVGGDGMTAEQPQDVYIVSMNGVSIRSVTICDEEIAEKSIRQLQARRGKIKVFRDRRSYLNFLEEQEDRS